MLKKPLKRVITVNLEILFYYIDRYLYADPTWKRILMNYRNLDIFNSIDKGQIKNILDLPLRIFVDENSKYFQGSLSNLQNILSPVISDIHEVVDLTKYMIIKILYYNEYISKEDTIKVEFISCSAEKKIKHGQLEILSFMLLYSNEYGELSPKIIKDIFENQKFLLLNENTQKSFYGTVFHKTRNKKNFLNDENSNPRINLRQVSRKEYLSPETISGDFTWKEVKYLYCPICAKKFSVSEKNNYINIMEDKIYFDCNHDRTIFRNYASFSYKFNDVMITKLNNNQLIKWFKSNIKPINKDFIYYIDIFDNNIQASIPTVKYLMNTADFYKYSNLLIKNRLLQLDVKCPICDQLHKLQISLNIQNDTNDKYKSYEELVYIKNKKYYFKCVHDGDFKQYGDFYIHALDDSTLELNNFKHLHDACSKEYEHIFHTLALVYKYSGVFVNGRKVIKRHITNDDFEILDLSSYLK